MNPQSQPHTPVFSGASVASHMPFFDGKTLLFCQAGPPLEHTFVSEGTIWGAIEANPRLRAHFANLQREHKVKFRRWKLHVADWKSRKARRVSTGLPEEAEECSPSFYFHDGTYHVSFIGGIPTSRWIQYGLYYMSGPALDKLSQARLAIDLPTRVGFVSRQYICTGAGSLIRLHNRTDGSELQFDCPLRFVWFVNYRADAEKTLIISGQASDLQSATLLHDIRSDETFSVQSPAEAYKPSVYGDEMLFAKSRGPSNEDRELWHGKAVVARTATIVRRVQGGSMRSFKALV